MLSDSAHRQNSVPNFLKAHQHTFFSLFSLHITWFHAIFKDTQFAKWKMFLCAVKDKEAFFFFYRSVLCINLFGFLSIYHMCFCFYLLTYFALMKEKIMLVRNFKGLEILQCQLFPEQPSVIRVPDKLRQSRQLACLNSSCRLSSP